MPRAILVTIKCNIYVLNVCDDTISGLYSPKDDALVKRVNRLRLNSSVSSTANVLTFNPLRTLHMFAVFLPQELMVAGAQNLPGNALRTTISLLSSNH